MISNKGVKINTKLIVISVIVLTILTLGVSYSAFFDVKVQDTVQSFTAGNLKVNVTNSNKISTALSVTPTSSLPTVATSAKNDSGYTTITLNNSGSVDAEFLVTLVSEAASNDALASSKIILGIYDESASSWIQFGSKFYTPLSAVTASSANNYPILKGTVNHSVTKTYRIYVWLSENAELTDISKKVKLSLKVKSVPIQGQGNGNTLGNVTVSS